VVHTACANVTSDLPGIEAVSASKELHKSSV
jgi:hypothetical protein